VTAPRVSSRGRIGTRSRSSSAKPGGEPDGGTDFSTFDSRHPRWPATAARSWYADQPWIVGACYLASSAVNQLEMWQAETFDPLRIDRELGWAQGLGFNAVRVFLHDLLWTEAPEGFLGRIDEFLTMAHRHSLLTLFVLFDSCWDPEPHPGAQPPPLPGVCMSRWVQSPGTVALEDRGAHRRLREYVEGVVRHAATDERVLGWDVWNEPDHTPDRLTYESFGQRESARKIDLVNELLPEAFDWVRSARPRQPVTSALWSGDWSRWETLRPTERIQIGLSDVLSFHSYEPPKGFERKIRWMEGFDRPVLCTEYMARAEGSTFRGCLPIARKYGVGAFSWGLVAGRSQANLPWTSWERPIPDGEGTPWFHEILTSSGAPYDSGEVEFIRGLTARTR
jgi:hypothetical protein